MCDRRGTGTELGQHRAASDYFAVQIFMLARIYSVDAAAEHGYGISVYIERRAMRNTVDSERHTRHYYRTGRGKVARYRICVSRTVLRYTPRADYRDGEPILYIRQQAEIVQHDRRRRYIPQLRRKVLAVIRQHSHTVIRAPVVYADGGAQALIGQMLRRALGESHVLCRVGIVYCPDILPEARKQLSRRRASRAYRETEPYPVYKIGTFLRADVRFKCVSHLIHEPFPVLQISPYQ